MATTVDAASIQTQISRISPAWRKLALAFFLVAYFLYFSWDSLKVRFDLDDMMNMSYYWRLKPLQLVLAQFMPWRAYYRPMAGLFQMPLLHAFGLNPVPFHIATSLLLLGNVFLMYRFARVLGCRELVAGLAALIGCYHAGLSHLYYNGAYIYDVLCVFFYLAAFVLYAGIRGRGRMLRGAEIAAFLGLYLCALNSKEMAVTLPVILLVYELLYHTPRAWHWKALTVWAVRSGRVVLFAGALNLVYLYGKVLRSDALINSPGYGPEFSRARLLDFQTRFFGDLLQKWGYFSAGTVLAVWIVLVYLAWRRNRPALRFCVLFLLLTPLPIEFILGRGGACLAIPLAGFAVILSMVFVDAAHAGARFLASEPGFGRLGRRPLFAAIVLAGVVLWGRQNVEVKKVAVNPAMAQMGELTTHVIDEFRNLNPRVRPNSRIIFLNDPFEGFHMFFTAELWFRDRGMEIRLSRKTPAPPEELAKFDHIFDYQNGRLMQVK